MTGICELTHRECELKESHLYPKLAYRMMKNTGGEVFRAIVSPNQIVRDGLKVYLLSFDAEQMFSKRESWFAQKLFTPYYKNEDFYQRKIEYNENFYYFAISILWRLLVYNLKEEGHCNPEYIKKYHLLEVAEEWRQFLLNGVYPMNYNKIYFFPLHNNVKYNLEYADYYLDRMFDSTFVWDNDGVRSSFFCKLPRYAFWATITESNTPTNYGISINPIKGIIDFQEEFTYDKIISNYGITQFYQGRILLTNQLIKDSRISKSQQEKIEQRMRSNKNFPDSELEQLLNF